MHLRPADSPLRESEHPCPETEGGPGRPEPEIIIRDDLPNRNLGYATTIEYGPGHLFVCYYGQEPDGVTCVQGTYLTLTS